MNKPTRYACGPLYQLKRIVLMKGKVSDHSQNLWNIWGEILIEKMVENQCQWPYLCTGQNLKKN
jgi:hypothetical protein